MKNDDAFLNDLAASRAAVDRFVSDLNTKQIYAEVLPQQTRARAENRFQFSDGGDVAVCFRVEHKVRTIRFQDAASFPFDSIYIDEVYKFDKNAAENPMALLAYVIESADHKCAAVIYNWTQPHWRIVKGRWDPKQNRYCDYYEIDKNFVRFCEPADVFGPRSLFSKTEHSVPQHA